MRDGDGGDPGSAAGVRLGRLAADELELLRPHLTALAPMEIDRAGNGVLGFEWADYDGVSAPIAQLRTVIPLARRMRGPVWISLESLLGDRVGIDGHRLDEVVSLLAARDAAEAACEGMPFRTVIEARDEEPADLAIMIRLAGSSADDGGLLARALTTPAPAIRDAALARMPAAARCFVDVADDDGWIQLTDRDGRAPAPGTATPPEPLRD